MEEMDMTHPFCDPIFFPTTTNPDSVPDDNTHLHSNYYAHDIAFKQDPFGYSSLYPKSQSKLAPLSSDPYLPQQIV